MPSPPSPPSPSPALPTADRGCQCAVEADDEGYESGASVASNETTVGDTRRAFLTCKGDDGLACRLAFGECRASDGVFVIASVLEEGAEVDVGSLELASMEGKFIALEDLDDAEMDFEWVEEEEEGDGRGSEPKPAAGPSALDVEPEDVELEAAIETADTSEVQASDSNSEPCLAGDVCMGWEGRGNRWDRQGM